MRLRAVLAIPRFFKLEDDFSTSSSCLSPVEVPQLRLCPVHAAAGLLEELCAPSSGLPPGTRCSALRALRAAFSRCGGRTPLGEELGGFLGVHHSHDRSAHAAVSAAAGLADAVLVAGGATAFSVSRAVLFARCPALLGRTGRGDPTGPTSGGDEKAPLEIRMGPTVSAEALHLLLQWAYFGSCLISTEGAHGEPPSLQEQQRQQTTAEGGASGAREGAAGQLRRLSKATGLHSLAALARPGGAPHARRTDSPPDLSADLGRLLSLEAPADAFPPFWDVLLLAAREPRDGTVACHSDDAGRDPPSPPSAAAFAPAAAAGGPAPPAGGLGAHRVVLVARSQYLRALLTPGAFRDAPGSSATFPEIGSLGALSALRWWLYTDACPWAPVTGPADRTRALSTALEAVDVYGAVQADTRRGDWRGSVYALTQCAIAMTQCASLSSPPALLPAAAQMRMLASLARFSEEHFDECLQVLSPRDALRLLVAAAAAGCWCGSLLACTHNMLLCATAREPRRHFRRHLSTSVCAVHGPLQVDGQFGGHVRGERLLRSSRRWSAGGFVAGAPWFGGQEEAAHMMSSDGLIGLALTQH